MDIDEIRKYCNDEDIMLTQHLSIRLCERNILYSEIVNTINYGEIIEEYPTDFPYPSCLIFGNHELPLHIVCSLYEGTLFIITAYRPDPNKWSSNMKERKEK